MGKRRRRDLGDLRAFPLVSFLFLIFSSLFFFFFLLSYLPSFIFFVALSRKNSLAFTRDA